MHTQMFDRPGGIALRYVVAGTGRPVLLVHGFISSAQMNWIDPGIASALVAAGFQVIAPDLRGHGGSSAPDDEGAYPADVLASDMMALAAAVALQGCDLVGYSLGARTAVRMVLAGFAPRRLVLGGMGLSGITDVAARQRFFEQAILGRDTLQRGEAGYDVARFLRTTGTRPNAALAVLRSQLSSPAPSLSRITMPTLVIAGDRDDDNGSAAALADALPDARYACVPGTHMTAISAPAFAAEISAFLQS